MGEHRGREKEAKDGNCDGRDFLGIDAEVLAYREENVDCQENNDHKADDRLLMFGILPLGECVPDISYRSQNA